MSDRDRLPEPGKDSGRDEGTNSPPPPEGAGAAGPSEEGVAPPAITPDQFAASLTAALRANAGTGPPVSKKARLAAQSAMRAMQAVMTEPIFDLTADSPPKKKIKQVHHLQGLASPSPGFILTHSEDVTVFFLTYFRRRGPPAAAPALASLQRTRR